MVRQTLGLIGFVMVALLGLATAVRAGGWAVVTLDSLPGEVRAGQDVRLGFMVRQHGVTPVDDFVKPYLSATHLETGEHVRVEARHEGAAGHFVVDVVFPSAGIWEWMIAPEPFMGTQLEPLTVYTAGPAPAAATSPGIRLLEPAVLRPVLGWTGTVMLLVAAALALTYQRRALGRWFVLRSR